eukprot:5050933-Pleurochrysis_carterae.AAC.1
MSAWGLMRTSTSLRARRRRLPPIRRRRRQRRCRRWRPLVSSSHCGRQWYRRPPGSTRPALASAPPCACEEDPGRTCLCP